MDIPSLMADLKALSAGDLDAVLDELVDAHDKLQKAILDGLAADPPADTAQDSADFALVDTWIRTLEAAVRPSPPPNADAELLAAMQAVDAATANSAAATSLLTAVHGLVQSFKQSAGGQ
jgi:hypothetical protein